MSSTDVAVALNPGPPISQGPAREKGTAGDTFDDLRRHGPVVSALMAAVVMAELDATVLATALPTIMGDLGRSGDLVWVNTAYLVTGTVAMPVLGRLGDVLGRRPVFLGALSILLAGSVLGAIAHDMPTLVAARAVQGLGGGGLLMIVYAVLADLIPARRRATMMTAVGAVLAVCAVAGPFLGGWVTQSVGWRWAFWFNVPLGVAAIVLAARTLPAKDRHQDVSLDTAGIGLLTVAVVLLTLLVTVAGRPGAHLATAALTAGLVLVVGLLVAVERRARQPLLPPALFSNRTFVAAVVAGLLLGIAMFGTIGYLPTYLQMASGLSPSQAGLMMLPLVAGLGSAAVIAARVLARTGRHRSLPVIGATLSAAALVLMSSWSADTSLLVIGACLALLGIGIGCAWEVLVVVAQSAVPTRHLGIATGANGLFREVGVLVGSAAVGAAFSERVYRSLTALERSSGLHLESLTPAVASRLAPGPRSLVATAYADALTPLFLVLALPLAIGAAVLLLVRQLHLSAHPVPDGDEG